MNLNPEDVAYVAYTGKASNVLKQKGCPNPTTAHKLLYYSKPLPNGKYIHTPRTSLENPYKLIIVDEISMLPKDMWELLLSHRIPVIACGDPGQLPPVDANQENHVLDNPHIFLDEIMRQAQESEIIRLSMHVREGYPLTSFPGRNEEVQIMDKANLTSGMYQWADQIICATNKTRNDINHCMRQLAGRGSEPEVGDKIIGLTNHWNFFSAGGAPLTNGAIGKIVDIEPFDIKVPFWIYPGENIKALRVDMHSEDDELYQGIPADYLALTTGQKTLTSQQEFQMNRAKNVLFPPPFDFAYGYAITCWKAQGSEWDKVLLLEENFPFNKEDHIKYLYTGITRSSKKLLVIKK